MVQQDGSASSPQDERLLTDDEILAIIKTRYPLVLNQLDIGLHRDIAKAQLAKDMEWEADTCANCDTSLSVDSQIQKAVDEAKNKLTFELGKVASEACQERVERIFKKIRRIVVGAYQSNDRENTTTVETQILSGLDALEEREGVK